MTTLTRAEAFAAYDEGKEVEFQDSGSPDWHDISGLRLSQVRKGSMRFRLKPKPQRARGWDAVLFNGELRQSRYNCVIEYKGPEIPTVSQPFKVREVLPNDMTGRQMADFVLEGIAQGYGVQTLRDAVEAQRDTLPEDSE